MKSTDITTGISSVDKLLKEADEHRAAARSYYHQALTALEAEKTATRPFLQTIVEQNAASQAQQAALTILAAAVLAIVADAMDAEVTEIDMGRLEGGRVS